MLLLRLPPVRLFCVALFLLFAATSTQANDLDDEQSVHIQMTVHLGADRGQNLGALFEAKSDKGKTCFGAGFLGSYNTQARSDRHVLQVFVKDPFSDAAFEQTALPRPSTDTGTYLYEIGNQLYSKGRSTQDDHLRVWDDENGTWKLEQNANPLSHPVGKGTLYVGSQSVEFNGQSIIQLPNEAGRYGENYYANGWLVCRRLAPQLDPPENELTAYRWSSDSDKLPKWNDGQVLKLRSPTEFVYAFGQLGNDLLAATNTGGVYRLRAPISDVAKWDVLIEPAAHSFQVYTMINFYDKLLLGHYPSGFTYEYDGEELRFLENFPPVMAGVSPNARELQTMTIYGGDLYAGVWPWGELWRYHADAKSWELVKRMFSHPTTTAATVHPYEKETTAVDPVLNLWGQRVTSLVPVGKSMFISTSSKSGRPFDPKFSFLNSEQWQEYGAVYRFHRPGHLSLPIEWKEDGPTTFDFEWTTDGLMVSQDGKLLGTLARSGKVYSSEIEQVTWGKGLFGPFRGQVISKKTESKTNPGK